MNKTEKEAILQYLKNCIVDDSKEELSIELDMQKSNSWKLFLPDKNNDFLVENFSFTEEELNLFFEKLKWEWIWKEKSEIILENMDILELENKEYFLEKCFQEYKSNSNYDKTNWNSKNIKTLIEFIKWWDNSLRQKTISKINNFIYYKNSDKEYLKWEDLEKLFFSWDNDEWIEKIEFFWNDNFLDFYDKNKKEKIYICLENVLTERNKKLIFQPLYFIEVEIEENAEEHFFTISISESNVAFNFFVEYYWKKLFKLENKKEKDEWFELEKDIDWLSSFKSKIDLYKANIIKDFDKDKINKNPCLISANDIWFIKWLLKEYQELIDEKDLSDIWNTGLWIIFNESNFTKNNILEYTNFTLLNKEQALAVKESLENKLSVIVWPPWTWKSQVVVNIMLNAYINNKTVLFASKNNTAVDTVLKKVAELNLSYYPFLRLWSKKAQDEWYPKIKNSLLQNTQTHRIDFQKITQLQDSISILENEIDIIEDNYLEYFEEYEKLEIILNDYEKSFKEYIYTKKIIWLDFELISEIKFSYLETLEKIEAKENEIKNEIFKIQNILNENKYLNNILPKIENWNLNNVNFWEIISWLEKHKNILDNTELKIEKNKSVFNEKLRANSYDDYLKNIPEVLSKILIKNNFINYENIKLSFLKEIQWDIIEAENFWFFKKLFWFKSRQIKKNRKLYYDIIEQQKNEKIKNYFLDFSENINKNTELLFKIKELYNLKWFEEKFVEYNKTNKEYSIYLTESEKEINVVKWECDNYIKQISNELFIDLYNYEYEKIINVIEQIHNLYWFIKNKNYLKIELNDKLIKNQNLITETNNYFNKNYDKEILNYISKIDNNNFIEKLDSILKLEEINIQTNIISDRFQELNYLEKNVTELNKEVFELQWILKDTSLDYLSYQISENINDIKPKLTDSVDKIYSEWYKDFSKEWWSTSKTIYLVEKYKKLFEWIKIFITTNLSTTSIPLEKWFYDYLIIDEASQNDIASIIPLLYRVKNVIIIWDPNQLQNIVSLKNDDIIKIFYKTLRKKNLTSKDYAEDFRDIYNFNNSVYSSFASIYKWKLNKNSVMLNEHFRCHQDIINYSNFIIEDYNLFPKVYWKNKNLQNTWIPIWIHWVEDIKSDNNENSKRNEKEAESIIRYLKEILQIMWDKISIWIIAPFRNQINYINELIRKNKLEWYENVLVDTVHKFQWDEKDIILFSTVYPNTKAYKFLNDVNLLNVAVSRARNSFLIFWDKQAIKNYKWENWEELLYTTLIRYIESLNKWKEVVKYRKYDTEFEKIFFEELEKAWIKFDYQFPIYDWKYTLDFRVKLKWANNYLNLELDWEIHNRQKSYDYTRNRKVEKLWYKVIRYSNSYMKENMWEVIDWLKKICELN